MPAFEIYEYIVFKLNEDKCKVKYKVLNFYFTIDVFISAYQIKFFDNIHEIERILKITSK